MSADDLQKQLDDVETLVRAVRGLERAPSASGVGNAQISVNAGGVAVWAAVAACFACLVGLLVGATFVAVAVSDLNRQTQEIRQINETQQAYINTYFSKPETDQ